MYYLRPWTITFWLIGINLSVIIFALCIFIVAIIKKIKKKPTKLFEISLLLLLIGVLFFTLHAKLLQFPFPISIPEKPLIDNNLTFNYTLTCLLAYLVFPVLLLIILKREHSLKSFGLKINNITETRLYTKIGIILSSAIFLVTYYFFGYKWISGYTTDGLILWIIFVSIISVFTQTFFYIGILFHYYSTHENLILLATISIVAAQTFVGASIPWIIANVLGSIVKIVVSYKSKNIYGAALMGISQNLIEIFIQIL